MRVLLVIVVGLVQFACVQRIHIADAIFTPSRSVKICKQAKPTDDCALFCKTLRDSDQKTDDDDTDILESETEDDFIEKNYWFWGKKSRKEAVRNCCCLFNKKWSESEKMSFNNKNIADKVDPDFEYSEDAKCSPLESLDDKKKLQYNLLCGYIEKHRPLTWLELLDFKQQCENLGPEELSFFETLMPSDVRQYINKDNVKEIMLTELEDTRNGESCEDAGAIIWKLKQIALELKELTNSKLIADAFNELVASFMLIHTKNALACLSRKSENEEEQSQRKKLQNAKQSVDFLASLKSLTRFMEDIHEGYDKSKLYVSMIICSPNIDGLEEIVRRQPELNQRKLNDIDWNISKVRGERCESKI